MTDTTQTVRDLIANTLFHAAAEEAGKNIISMKIEPEGDEGKHRVAIKFDDWKSAERFRIACEQIGNLK